MLTLEDILTAGVYCIQEEMASQDINATGRSGRCFRVSMEGFFKGKIVYDYEEGVNAPLPTLEEGRGPGKMPPVEAVRDWLDIRGIGAESERDRIAWAIAKVIAASGTGRHRNPSSVLSAPVEEIKRRLDNPEFIKTIITYLWQRKNS